MDHDRFRDWLSRVDELTAAQRSEVAAVLSEPSEGAAALAAIELGVDEERRCPHCGAGGAVKRGKARGLRRFRCKECGKTFGALTGTALSGLHHKERWLAFGASLAEGETIKASAERCGIAPSTAHRWRHRFLAAVRQAPDRLAGIVEADETSSSRAARGSGSWSERRAGAACQRRRDYAPERRINNAPRASAVACPRSPREGPARGATRPPRGWRRPARGRGLWAHGVKRVIRTSAGAEIGSA